MKLRKCIVNDVISDFQEYPDPYLAVSYRIFDAGEDAKTMIFSSIFLYPKKIKNSLLKRIDQY